MDFFIYRNNEFIEKLAPSEIKLTRSLSGVFFLTFKTQQNIQQNDVLKTRINDTEFTFNIEQEKNNFKAYHRIYNLSKKLFLRETDGADQFGIIGYEANKAALESYLTGFGFNLIDSLDESLKDNLKAVDYSSDNVLSALTKFLEAFGAEHEFNDYNIYIKTRVGLDIPQQFIQAGGNTNAITKEIDTSNIITRLYPKGKSDNLDVLENYYYNELRPVNYDFINKKIEDNPQLYIDSSVIGQYGVIEQIKEFDVRLHNLNGTVISWGQITIDEENYNYIDIDKTIDLSVLEANQCTLFMTKGFEQVQEVRIKYNSCTTTRIVYYPQLTNKDIYNIDFINGTYILMGYITQTQYDEAKNQLITEANNYLEQHKEAKITYSINFAYFSEQDRQQINLSVNIGDAVRLIDKSQAIDTEVRVLDFEYDLKLGMYNKITFSNTFERMPVNSIIDEMYVKLLEQQKKIREEALLLNGSVQTARTALERHELLVQKQFYGSENEYVRIGSEDRNYQVHGLEIVPTLERIDWTEFRFQEVAEDISYKIASGNKIETTTIDYFMSIRIDKNDTENLNNGNIISFNVEMEKGEIGGYTYYPLGVVRFVAGKVAMPAIDKGFTLIHGDFIQTGTVQADYIRVGSDADTRVSEGEEANQIVQENKNVWDQAAINAQNALSNISDMSSDSKITPTEKINLKREFDIATQEKTNVVLTAESIRDNAGNEIPTIVTAKTNLITAYNALNTYVSPLLVDMSVTSDVNSTTLTQKFTDFYDKLNGVYKAIDEHLNVARNFADNVSTTNYTEINGGKIKTGTVIADYIRVGSDADARVSNGEIAKNFADNVSSNNYTEIHGGKITTGTVTADQLEANFTIKAGQYIQAGDETRNYKLDGTQGLIRTIGSNTYNIYCYVTSGEVNFDGTVIYKDIDLTNYGLTDYIAILNFQQMQFWRSVWTTSKNLTLTYAKISSNILRILAYFSDDVVWTTKTGPEISFTVRDSWHTLVTTATDTTGARVYWNVTTTSGSYTESNTLTHYYRIPGTYTIKVRGNERGNQYISIDWGDGIITTDGDYYRSWATPVYSFKYVAEGHSGNPQPLWGKINYAVLGY